MKHPQLAPYGLPTDCVQMCTDLHTFVQNLPTADPIAVNKIDFIYARVINTDKL